MTIPMPHRLSGAILAGLALLGASILAPAAARAAAPSPCPNAPTPLWQGRSTHLPVTVPASGRPYEGTVLRPAMRLRYPGRRPGVVLMHGLGGNQCGLWWAARHLAGHGYVALVLTNKGRLASHVRAVRDGVAFLRSQRNPFHARTDRDRIGLVGYSQGAAAVSLVQGQLQAVRAVAAFDNLRRWASGDPGAALGCRPPRIGEVRPRVPALGMALDAPCARPQPDGPEIKKTGYQHWRRAGLPALQLVPRDFEHGTFARGGSDAERRFMGHYLLAWMDRWLRGQRPAVGRLLARRVDGTPVRDLLSLRYRSAAHLPRRIDCPDLRQCLP